MYILGTMDGTLAPKLDIDVGSRARFFQTPETTPSATNTLRHSAYTSAIFNKSNRTTSRKRPRNDCILPASSTPSASAFGWDNVSSSSSLIYSPDVISPPPLVNSNYRLAGGLDTPTGAAASAFENDVSGAAASDLGFRRGRDWTETRNTTPIDYFNQATVGLDRERNGHARMRASNEHDKGWGRTFMSTVSGVAGKVWQFCKAGSFVGFYAGGGQGYALPTPLTPSASLGQYSTWQALDDTISAGTNTPCYPRPSRIPSADFIPDYMSNPDMFPLRAAKKAKCDHTPRETHASWIMINSTPSSQPPKPASPTRSRLAASTASSPSFRRRQNISPSRPAPILHHRPASFVSAHSPTAAKPRSSHRSTRSDLSGISKDSSGEEGTKTYHSPLSDEAQRYIEQARRKEKEEDRELRKLNKRLQTMIREGKEALGTKIEIEEEEDEGFVDGDWGGGDK